MTDKLDLSKIPEPSWLKEVSPNSCLNHKDICAALKINPSTLNSKINNGGFPPPDLTHVVGRTLGKGNTFTNKRLWRVSTIRKFLKGESNENVQTTQQGEADRTGEHE
jgi:hypothetical protein